MSNFQEWKAKLNPVYDDVRFLAQQVLPDGRFQLTALGRLGQSYALFASTNLTDWPNQFLNKILATKPTVFQWH